MIHREYEVITELLDDPANQTAEGDSEERNRQIGAWRWPLMQEAKDVILPLIRDVDLCVDLGGAAGPVGYGAVVVDRISETKSLTDLIDPIDTIFTSHTLEHIPNVALMCNMMHFTLKPGGWLIVHVPHHICKTLRAENWPYHCWTFYLAIEKLHEEPGPHWLPLDSLLEKCGFKMQKCWFNGHSLLLTARKPE